MSEAPQRPDVDAVLSRLKDFQRETVDYAFRRLYTDDDLTHRFLVADEVGLGKTLVARGIVAKAIDHLWDSVEKIDVVYICSNADIARQNLRRLNVAQTQVQLASRMTLLPREFQKIARQKLNLISFTPATSFQLKHAAGWAEERVLLYWMLNHAWGIKGAAPCNLLQGRISDADRFRARVRDYPRHEIDDDLAAKFCAALEQHVARDRAAGIPDLRERFDELCSVFAYRRDIRIIPLEQRQEQNRLIGDLRAVLAGTCIRALEPDVVILDEFQRFKDLLTGEDDASMLARELFDYEGEDGKARILLLSATPYRMYTTAGDAEGAGDHYRDFLQTLRFLQNDETATRRTDAILQEYRRAMMRLASDGPARVLELKAKLEAELRKVMVRTERLSASEDRNGMLREVTCEGVRLETRDVTSYRALQKLARHVEQPDAVEYWKAAPYLLNFMPDYRLKQEVVDAIDGTDGDGVLELLAADDHLLASKEVLEGRAPVDPPHPRLRWLMDDTIGRGLWKLLWLPPALPYYEPTGPFADPAVQGATKRLVFSAWRVVPRAVSALLSREAERRMFGVAENERRTLDRIREKAPLLLRFTRSEGRLTGMPVLGLLYPSLTLAQLGNPVGLRASVAGDGAMPALDDVLAAARQRIGAALSDLTPGTPGGAADAAWYWMAPVLLDLHREPEVTRRWLHRGDLAARWAGADEQTPLDEQDTLWTRHVTELLKYVDDPSLLGPRPADLAEVLALMAVAGPSVAALRSLGRLGGGMGAMRNDAVRDAAAHVGWGIRNLFNLPDVTALVRGMHGEEPYWQRTLEYSAAGNLQAMLDEYAHVLPESLGMIEAARPSMLRAVANEMRQAVGIRAAQVPVDHFDTSPTADEVIERHRLRARFAARFGEQEEDEKGARSTDAANAQTRTSHLRSAFNSPFWPFVLVTTSVGQEGLDFHQYCHAVVHWNLPSNPVDLEQREGRVHRYKGHAVRRNVARALGAEALDGGAVDPWGWMFSAATARRGADASDIVPFWVYSTEGGARIERHVPALPLSQDVERLTALRRTLVLYRMVFGQPRQDELLQYLLSRMSAAEARECLELIRIDLRPAIAPCGSVQARSSDASIPAALKR